VAAIKLKEVAAPANDLVTIIMAQIPKAAAVHAGAHVILNFVKFVRNFTAQSNKLSFKNVTVTVTWQSQESDKPSILSSPVTLKPPNMFLVTLERVTPKNEGIYKVEVCIRQSCAHSTVTLVVVTGEIYIFL